MKKLINCVNGLKEYPDTINSVFPDIILQPCIVHTVRVSPKYVTNRDYKTVTEG